MYKKDITVCFETEAHMNKFINMLAWMEFCGNIGHCTTFSVRMDGDGTARPKFYFDTPEFQKSYEELRHGMKDTYEKSDETDLLVSPEVHFQML